MKLCHFCFTSLIDIFLGFSSIISKVLYYLPCCKTTLPRSQVFIRITVQLLISLFSLRPLSAWSLCNCSLIWSDLASFHLCNLASELIIQPKLLSFRCFLIFTLLWINLMLNSLHYSMLHRHLIWWIKKSYYNVLRLPSTFLALLFIIFARTFLIALRWWYWVTHVLLGLLSNLRSLTALFWALSSTSYSQLIILVCLFAK